MAPQRPTHKRFPAILVATALLAVATAGCFGGEPRSDWAYDMTQLSDAADRGLTGKGIRVGVLDTGINVAHSSLDHLVDGDNDNGELKGFRDFLSNEFGLEFAHDDHGHGSHVVGIMAARGSSFTDKLLYGGIDLLGGSPSIQIWVAKVCGTLEDGTEGCDPGAINRALEWMGTQQVDVVSMSLGGDRLLPTQLTDQTADRVNSLVGQGIVVIASAGNDGPDNEDVNQPADIPAVIAVGAVTDDRRVWSQSSRGDPSENRCTTDIFGGTFGRCDPNKKPEIVAPGVEILSAWAGDAYVLADGTSQATPFVTSVVALMLEGNRKLESASDVAALKQVLVSTASKITNQQEPHDNAAGYGLVQALDAIDAYA